MPDGLNFGGIDLGANEVGFPSPLGHQTPINAQGSTASGTLTLYTVPTGKKLYLTTYGVDFNITAGTSEIAISDFNGSTDTKLLITTPAVGPLRRDLAIPIEIPEGRIIRIINAGLGADVYLGYIIGWIE